MLPSDEALWQAAAKGHAQSDKIPGLDLHGQTLAQAMPELESFLNRQFMAGERIVKVICGIGTGRLMAEAEKTLSDYKKSGLVERYIKPFPGVYVAELAENGTQQQ